jgi:hypothetical protein
MSVTVMALVWQTDLPPHHKLVLLAYADHANDDGESIYPGAARMAAKTSYSPGSIGRTTKDLVAAGLLIRVRRGYRGQRAEFAIDLDTLKGAQSARLSKGAQIGRERRALVSRKARAGARPNHQEPSQPSSGDERERTLAAVEKIRDGKSWTDYLKGDRDE